MDHVKPQLVIRLKTAKNNLPPPPETTYVYLWDRIFAALAALLLLIGLAAYGVYLLLQTDTAPGPAYVIGSNSDAPRVSKPEMTPERQETRHDEALERSLRKKLPAETRRITEIADNPIRQQPAAPDNGVSGMQPEETDGGDLSAQRLEPPAAAPIQETGTYASRAEQRLHSPPGETAAEQTQKERIRSAPDIAIAKNPAPETKIDGTGEEVSTSSEESKMLVIAPDDDTGKGLFRLRDITLISPSVSRFVLAKSVVNNKPVGDVDDIVPDARGIAAVYAFSDVVGLKDEVLYYYWFRNSEQVAKVRAGVWADRWRSYSSKIINNKMRGEWRVELLNKKREVLASADFVY